MKQLKGIAILHTLVSLEVPDLYKPVILSAVRNRAKNPITFNSYGKRNMVDIEMSWGYSFLENTNLLDMRISDNESIQDTDTTINNSLYIPIESNYQTHKYWEDHNSHLYESEILESFKERTLWNLMLQANTEKHLMGKAKSIREIICHHNEIKQTSNDKLQRNIKENIYTLYDNRSNFIAKKFEQLNKNMEEAVQKRRVQLEGAKDK